MKKPIPLLAAVLSALVALSACGTQQTVVKVTQEINLPKKIRIVAQSCDANVMYQTVIDLETNEIVILVYNELNLLNVIRTGIQGDPDKQSRVSGRDAPALATGREQQRRRQFN